MIEAGADPESGYAKVLEFCAIKGVGVVEDEHTQGEYDYLKFVTRSFPPHSRGWTGHGGIGREPGSVSPARAGMDP